MMIAHQYLDHLAGQVDPRAEHVRALFGQAVHFDCGDVWAVPKAHSAFDQVMVARPPFPITLLQFALDEASPSSHILIWVHEVDVSHINMISAIKSRSGQWITNRFEFLCNEDGVLIDVVGADQEAQTAGKFLYGLAKNFFYVLGCSNVATVDVAAPAPLNKKRAKKGAAPIQTYKTLHLVVPTVNGARANLGGAHSSPRVHLRRGHVRQLQDGRRIWVQACVVGAKHGVVHKDYAISYGVAA